MSDGTSRQLEQIPVGHYHRVMETGHPIRRAWHLLKFQRVLDLCDGPPGALLDVGCFAGSLLSLAPQARFPRQLGVDILPEQVAFAEASFGAPFRHFQHLASLAELGQLPGPFHYATCVEVIEHLTREEIRTLFLGVARLLAPGGHFVLSTPNYTSTWPVLELLLNRLSDVDYSEQHITKFNFFSLQKKLAAIVPELPALFSFELTTTTHWVSPFLAVFGVETATRVGSAVPHARWWMPFGNLVLFRLRRTDAPVP
jgi:2-polyprenyl-3-methyl-5-hydroxy-6-metoxy-1,4-benzoquinol methylase